MKLKDIVSYGLIIIAVVLIRSYVMTPIKVNGDSMYPTLHDKDLMILTKYNRHELKRNDIVVVKLKNEKIIKRVIGLPKEDVEYKNGNLYVNNDKHKDSNAYGDTEDFVDYCSGDEYFVMGDNREISYDSREIGCVKKEDIIGKTNFIFFPFKKFGKINNR